MQSPIPDTTLHCTQCGGELHPEEGQIFITCPYCSSTVYVDKSQVVFHWYRAPTINETEARASLARWMAGNQTVKDLDRKARLTGQSFEYFPVWYLKQRAPDGKEFIFLQPAAATSVSEVTRLHLPAGDLRKYDASLDAQSHTPSVPLQTAMTWMQEKGVPASQIVERSLVHIPLYTFKYDFQNRPYTAIVEGGTGGVLANIYPAKAEAPYLLAGGVTAIVFLCLATFPVIGAMANNSSGLGIGLLACSALGLIAAPILFAFAAWVAAKI